jgi:hypothetical protein
MWKLTLGYTSYKEHRGPNFKNNHPPLTMIQGKSNLGHNQESCPLQDCICPTHGSHFKKRIPAIYSPPIFFSVNFLFNNAKNKCFFGGLWWSSFIGGEISFSKKKSQDSTLGSNI